MKICFTIGRPFKGRGELIYNSVLKEGFKIDNILYVFPSSERILRIKSIPILVRKIIAVCIDNAPIWLLKLAFVKYIPKVNSKIFYTKNMNSFTTIKKLKKINPDIIIVNSCGIIKKEFISEFENVVISAHAGKLPEYRGVNNVEWTYYEGSDLYGTILFISEKMDDGDLVYEGKIDKLNNPKSIDSIREHAFNNTFSFFAKAIRNLNNPDFQLIKQHSKIRTNRYIMHPFLKHLLQEKLKMPK